MSVFRADASRELVARKSADLEEMITMSVFNAQQFNHYCVQVVNGKVQLYINAHECIRDLEVEDCEIKNVTLPAGAQVAKVSFSDKPLSLVEVEQLSL